MNAPAPVPVIEQPRPSPERFEDHVEACQQCRNGFLCDVAHELIEEIL